MTPSKSASQYDEAIRFFVLHSFPKRALEERWRTFLSGVDSPSAYDSPAFFLEPYWEGKHPFAVLAFKASEMVGVVTGLHFSDRVICGLPSRPQLCVKDDDNGKVTETLRRGVLWESGPAKLIEIFSWHATPLPTFEGHGFQEKTLEGDVVLDLRLGAEALFKQFHENRKRNIRAAIRHGVEVSEEKTEEDVGAYWEVYRRWQDTERKKIQAGCSFSEVKQIHELSANHRRFIARFKGKPIAETSVRFCPCGLIEYTGNCSLDEFNSLRPNDLLIWRTIEWACQQGFHKYSLGAAHAFLTKSGGVIEPIDRYRLDRTFLHRYEWKENVQSLPHRLFHALPAPLQRVTRDTLKQLMR